MRFSAKIRDLELELDLYPSNFHIQMIVSGILKDLKNMDLQFPTSETYSSLPAANLLHQSNSFGINTTDKG
jgi:hypothetical protein